MRNVIQTEQATLGYLRIYMCMHIYTYIYTYVHIYIHTYLYKMFVTIICVYTVYVYTCKCTMYVIIIYQERSHEFEKE